VAYGTVLAGRLRQWRDDNVTGAYTFQRAAPARSCAARAALDLAGAATL